MRRVADPEVLVKLFEEDRETHIYGLADLEEPIWPASSWFMDGGAAVGLVSLGKDSLTGYAMSQIAPAETLSLLLGVSAQLPPGSLVTGPLGMTEALTRRGVRELGPHWRLILDRRPRGGGQHVSELGPEDTQALSELHASDPGSSFFLPGMVANGHFVGIWDGGRLVASAGTHVASMRHGVAAIGAVITKPTHRGRGLGQQVVSALCGRLWGLYRTIGLNVAETNTAALALYDTMGFRRAFRYEEVELL